MQLELPHITVAVKILFHW